MTLFYFYLMNYKSTLLIATTIIISALIISFSNRFLPSPVNESFIIDSNFLTSKNNRMDNLLFLIGLIIGPIIYKLITQDEINISISKVIFALR